MIHYRFPKIPRLSREMVITEKLDGTCCVVAICEDLGEIRFGSKSRWLTEEFDHYGFWKWADSHREELLGLGHGYHYGEWWGGGCQRCYGKKKGDMQWSLFNAERWRETPPPSCCSVVPVLYRGEFSTPAIEECMSRLAESGSVAAPGFMRPEGVIVYHSAGKNLFKKTFGTDGHTPKTD